MTMNDEPRCKNCRWWWTNIPGNVIGSEVVPAGWSICELAEGTRGRADHTMSRALAIDFDENGAQLITAPDFGCVQWEAR